MINTYLGIKTYIMKKAYFLFFLLNIGIANAQSVGIGTTTPNSTAQLHVDVGTSTTKGFLVTGTYNGAATVPDLGFGYRLMFYPGKGAFRAGYVTGTQWNNANVGILSTALGTNTIASSTYSTSLGHNTVSSSPNSMAMGEATTASGNNSTAMGYSTTASGSYSTAMGNGTIASGYFSTAIGYNTTASGRSSTAIGYKVNTNGNTSALIIGDSDPNNEGITYSGYPDEFVARFWNGYYFMTSGNSSRSGVTLVIMETHG